MKLYKYFTRLCTNYETNVGY